MMRGMNITEGEWNGYRKIGFEYSGKQAVLVFPKSARADGRWLFKTEYFGAFPAFELEMLERGFFVAHIDNDTRWCTDEDTERQYSFARLLHTEFGLCEKCMTVGMSCGGMQAVNLAAKHPDAVACMYLDAPVLNLLSCPCGIGDAGAQMYDEFVAATGKTVSELINYRKHPIDLADELIKNDIPVFLVCGDSDRVVPYKENGAELYRKYTESGKTVFLTLKKGCDHHPHGLDDNAPLVEFALKYYK